MVLSARLAKRSLLFGYSCFWILTQLTVPSFWLPDFARTKSEHILKLILRLGSNKLGKLRLNVSKEFMQKFWTFTRVFFEWRARVVLLIYLIYFVISIVFTMDTQADFLSSYGITRASELSYKALYYSPIVHVSKTVVCNIELRIPEKATQH